MQFMGPCLLSSQVRKMTEFYTMLLNTTADGDDVHAAINTHGAALSIYNPNTGDPNQWSNEGSEGRRKFTLGVRCDDVDAEYQRLTALGVEVLAPPETHPWGWRSMSLLDPDGNMIDIACPVMV